MMTLDDYGKMVVIKDFEMPKSCLMCTKRKCLHIDGKAYQMCGLNEDGYLRESWFDSENIPKDCRSEHCPLREVEAIPKDQYEARLKADLVAMLTEIQLEIEELKNEPAWCQHFVKGVCRSSEVIQQKINALKAAEQED